jgi:uncharacterized protein (DUF58 family)
MPTRQGWLVLVGGAATVVVGRLFGVRELFALGVAMIVIVLGAWAVVRFRPVRLRVARRVNPTRVYAGEPARVEIAALNRARFRTPIMQLRDPVSTTGGARVDVAPFPGGTRAYAAYRLPTARRGMLYIGPLRLTRIDALGLATRSMEAAPRTSVMVLPRWHRIGLPGGGRNIGALSSHLRIRALGREGDEFRSLRDYSPGDDLRKVHWKASARSEELKVRDMDTTGSRSLTVVLDLDQGAYSADAFERAVTAAASILVSATELHRSARFETSEGTLSTVRDTNTDAVLEHLAVIEPTSRGALADTLNGLGARALEGVVVLICGTYSERIRQALRATSQADATVLVVCAGALPLPASSTFVVDATTDAAFVTSWTRIVGHPEHRVNIPQPARSWSA